MRFEGTSILSRDCGVCPISYPYLQCARAHVHTIAVQLHPPRVVGTTKQVATRTVLGRRRIPGYQTPIYATFAHHHNEKELAFRGMPLPLCLQKQDNIAQWLTAMTEFHLQQLYHPFFCEQSCTISLMPFTNCTSCYARPFSCTNMCPLQQLQQMSAISPVVREESRPKSAGEQQGCLLCKKHLPIAAL